MPNPKELRAWFETEGLSISQWASNHGFKPREVYALLSGKTTGVRGRAHKVAVALGLRPPPKGSAKPYEMPSEGTDDDVHQVATEDNRQHRQMKEGQ